MPVELFGGTAATGIRPAKARAATVASAAAGGGFADSLTGLIESVEETQGEANVAVSNMIDKKGEVHEAMIALQRAEMTFQLTVQICNKLVQAYQDIMRMPI